MSVKWVPQSEMLFYKSRAQTKLALYCCFFLEKILLEYKKTIFVMRYTVHLKKEIFEENMFSLIEK